MNETAEVKVSLKDGRLLTGFPDGRQSQRGQLVLIESESGTEQGPFIIDEVDAVVAAG